MHELPLVFFTVLGQTAAGAFILLVISRQFNLISERQLSQGLLASMALMCIGMAVGSIHMGVPLRMLNMLSGVGRSAMSNELLLAGAFTGLGLLSALGLYFKKAPEHLLMAVAWVASVVAALFIASIPAIYQLEMVASWNTSHTSFQMIMTALISGGALATVFGASRLGGWSSALGIILILVFRPDYFSFLAQVEPVLSSAQTVFWGFQAVMLVAGLLMVMAKLLRRVDSSLAMASCAVMLVAGELAGRIAFYNLWVMPM